MENKHSVFLGEDGFVVARGVNVICPAFPSVTVDKETYDGFEERLLTAYRYDGHSFSLDETRTQEMLNPLPAFSELDEIRMALAELAELVTGGI